MNWPKTVSFFNNHFTVSTPCGPARTSLLTGLYIMNHRSVRNGTPLDANLTNIAKEVRKKGHDPLLFGYTDSSVDPRGLASNDPASKKLLKVYCPGLMLSPL